MYHRLKRIAPVFARFLLVGFSGALVNLAVLWALHQVGLEGLAAALVATEVSIIYNFSLHDRWTFKHAGFAPRHPRLYRRFAQYQAVTSVTSGITLGLFVFFSGPMHLHYLLAQFIAIGMATFLNFSANAALTWRQSQPVANQPSSPQPYPHLVGLATPTED